MPEYSPIFAVFTGIMESLAAVFTFLSPGRKRILYPAGLLFLLLAGYQFAEVAVCANPDNLLLSRLAFFDITWLPPVGLWLAYQAASPPRRGIGMISAVYFAAAAFLVTWIFLDPGCVTKSVCQLVIARYQHSAPFETVYGVFYQSGLMLLIFGTAAGMVSTADAISRKHLANLQVGVLGFVLPSLYIRILYSEPPGILPSVMCHFALLLAISLLVLVVRERRTSK